MFTKQNFFDSDCAAWSAFDRSSGCCDLLKTRPFCYRSFVFVDDWAYCCDFYFNDYSFILCFKIRMFKKVFS